MNLQARAIHFLVILVMLGLIPSCATPTDQLLSIADSQNFTRGDVRANGFSHFVLQNTEQFSGEDTLHVYLEGDGSPWKYRVLVMRDPTPRQPLMLKLMGLDSNPAVYLGRPCYNGSFDDEGCSEDLWTSSRYSETVVSSMSAALRKLQQKYGVKDVRLFGHSGGGALAMLIAERNETVSHVVTLAGNLDTEAWIAHHNFTPLYGSLNPAKRTPLRTSVAQWHFLGRKDSVIPPTIVKPFLKAQKNTFASEISSFSHGCCWQRLWPAVLSSLKNSTPERLPGMRVKTTLE